MPSSESKSPKAAAPTNRSMILSPSFRSAAAMAGWDEEALLFATLVVEDTPVRESRQHKYKKRLKSPASTTSSTRKRRARRQSGVPIPPVVLCLEDGEDGGENKTIKKEAEKAVVDTVKEGEKERALSVEPNKGLPCFDRLREELSCAICLEICFEPSTTPCGHSFCIRCLKCAATKCGKKCPKCRQLISNGRACTINTVLWNTIQLLFPEEVDARKKSKVTATPPAGETRSRSMQYAQHTANTSSNSRRSSSRSRSDASEASRVTASRSSRTRVGPSQSEDAAMALRLQREEFMVAFQGNNTQGLRRQALNSAHASLRSMVSRGFYTRTRSSDSDYL